MLPRTEQPVPRKTVGRRLFVVKMFVIVTGVLVVAGVVLFCTLGRTPAAASAAAYVLSPGSTPEVKTRPHETDPRLNEYMYEDRYVLEAVVPGVNPDIHVDYDPLTLKRVLTLSWSPPERPQTDSKKRYRLQEWQPTPFVRKVPLPEGVSTPEATLKDGILTLSFPRHRSVPEKIVPRQEN